VKKEPLDALRASHTPEAIRERLDEEQTPSYLKDFIYGAVDGLVTTFAVVSGVQGAGIGSGIVIVLGMANLVADGLSMAASNYLGTKVEEEMRAKKKLEEEYHIKTFPEGEREEVRQIFMRKGFEQEDLERIVEVITSDKKLWVRTMLQDEHGIPLKGPNPFRAGATTFVAFLLVGFIPLSPFVINWLFGRTAEAPFFWSIVLTLIAFFTVGALKSRFILQRWYIAGCETLLIGGIAASLAYGIGWALRGLVE